MSYNKIDDKFLFSLKDILAGDKVISGRDEMEFYSHDETEDFHYYPEVVVKPGTVEEVAAIMKLCQKHKVPLTPRGAGTGLSGGALAIYGGVLLSVEKLNRIIEIDERNFQVTVEPGVITEVLQNAVKEKGLFYPPDPASRGSCFIGGNIAENSGGPKAVKYGVTNEYVLNLEVVLPNGEVIWTGANVLKNATGYNLTQLITGSEGTLGIVTKAVLKLIPHPKEDLLLLVPFYSAEQACEAVAAIMKEGIIPSGLEFMERNALDWGIKYTPDVNLELKKGIEAYLLIEVDGNDRDVLFKECEAITGVIERFECDEVLFAEDASQKERLWKVRKCLGEAVKSHSIYKEEDTVVPRAELPKLLKGVKQIGEKYGFESVCYGHAGDGNLHVNIVKAGMTDDEWENKLPEGIREIFTLCKELGGTISGEHGIGLVQKSYMDIVFSKANLDIQKGIKKLFDPDNILNPGKIFDEN